MRSPSPCALSALIALAVLAPAAAREPAWVGTATYNPAAATEADRQALNAWIRRPGNFDAVIDFDAAMRDPTRPDRLRPDLVSGDHLHPSIAGYRAIAEAVPLTLFSR